MQVALDQTEARVRKRRRKAQRPKPAAHFVSRERAEAEIALLRRIPLVIGHHGDLPEPGSFVTTEVLGKRTFARPMQKRDNGVYVKIRFELDPNQVAALLGRYHLAEDVFRVQILAVDDRRETVLARQAEERKAREAARAEAEAAANENKDTQSES